MGHETVSSAFALPASYAQEGLWLFDQLNPGTGAYTIPLAFELEGPLDERALERSLGALVGRHETLRTTFGLRDGVLVQLVADAADVPLERVDLPDRREEALRRLGERARLPFDLERGPLLRATLVRLGDERRLLGLALHHVVCDGWSLSVLARDLGALYTAEVEGSEPDLPLLRMQYGDFAQWQRERLDEERLEELAGYWRDRLADAPKGLELPSDRPRPARPTFRGHHLPLALSEQLPAKLRELAQAEGAGEFVVVAAAFAALLARYTGAEEVVFGTPVSTREDLESEQLIGFFVNTLVLRIDLRGDPSFRGLVRRVRSVVLEAQEHADLPFEKLVEALAPDRAESHTPLFEVMVTYDDVPPLRLELPGATARRLPLQTGLVPFELGLDLEREGDRLSAALEYGTDLFDGGTAARLVGHLERLLAGALDRPELRVSELPLLAEEERRAARGWQGQRIAVPHALVHELFERQAARVPGADAVVHDGERVTYDELNRRANRLAAHLRDLGVGPGVPVGICLERSIDLVEAVLAVLKAGGAYVPLDPGLPPKRIELMLGLAGAAAAITLDRYADRVTGLVGSVVRLDAEAEAIAGHDDADVPAAASPDDLAYVLFTSGSTGVPKGVMVSHRSLVSVYAAWEVFFELREHPPSHLQVADFTFDVCTGELVRALLSGGKLVVCPKPVLLEPEELHALMVEEAVTCAEFVPTSIRLLVDHLEATGQRLELVRVLAVGSEAWTAGEHERLRRLLGPRARLVNSYGLTEATIDSTCFEGDLRASPPERVVPIGRPCPNATAHVLDRELRPLPPGAVGELYVGGPGVSLGYAGRPALTAERFVPDPFSRRPGARLYATGDRARRLADGTIEYRGRADHQVKVRGFRIELGEVESALAAHPLVRAAVATVRDEDGEKRLVAHLLPEGRVPSADELREWLLERLPGYMLPSAFVAVERWPLTPSGKVDRKALPPAGQSEAERAGDGHDLTATEETLRRVWSEVLGREVTDVHGDFFRLGGESLAAVRIVARLRETTNVALSVRTLFERRTIAELARALDERGAGVAA